MALKFCPNCGKQNTLGSNFCSNCGANLQEKGNQVFEIVDGVLIKYHLKTRRAFFISASDKVSINPRAFWTSELIRFLQAGFNRTKKPFLDVLPFPSHLRLKEVAALYFAMIRIL